MYVRVTPPSSVTAHGFLPLPHLRLAPPDIAYGTYLLSAPKRNGAQKHFFSKVGFFSLLLFLDVTTSSRYKEGEKSYTFSPPFKLKKGGGSRGGKANLSRKKGVSVSPKKRGRKTVIWTTHKRGEESLFLLLLRCTKHGLYVWEKKGCWVARKKFHPPSRLLDDKKSFFAKVFLWFGHVM